MDLEEKRIVKEEEAREFAQDKSIVWLILSIKGFPSISDVCGDICPSR